MSTPLSSNGMAEQLSSLEQQIASLKEQLAFHQKANVKHAMDTDILEIVQGMPGISTHALTKALMEKNKDLYPVATASGLRKYVLAVLESMVKDGLLVNLAFEYPGLNEPAWAPAPATDEA